VFDGKADHVFEAIIKKKYCAIRFWEPQPISVWRHYGGSLMAVGLHTQGDGNGFGETISSIQDGHQTRQCPDHARRRAHPYQLCLHGLPPFLLNFPYGCK
jgi:hypothetical protein